MLPAACVNDVGMAGMTRMTTPDSDEVQCVFLTKSYFPCLMSVQDEVRMPCRRHRSGLSWPRPAPASGSTSISRATARPSSPMPARWDGCCLQKRLDGQPRGGVGCGRGNEVERQRGDGRVPDRHHRGGDRTRHYSESGELLATTLAILECLQREGFVTVERLSHGGRSSAARPRWCERWRRDRYKHVFFIYRRIRAVECLTRGFPLAVGPPHPQPTTDWGVVLQHLV